MPAERIQGLGSMVGLPCLPTDDWEAECVITDLRPGTNGWDFFIQPTGRSGDGRWIPAHSVRTPLTMDEEAFRRQVSERSLELDQPAERVQALDEFTLATAGTLGRLTCDACGWTTVLDDPVDEGVTAAMRVHHC